MQWRVYYIFSPIEGELSPTEIEPISCAFSNYQQDFFLNLSNLKILKQIVWETQKAAILYLTFSDNFAFR